jgi:hypothetical protein
MFQPMLSTPPIRCAPTRASLANVERAFRSLKTVDPDIRPIFHWVSSRVRAHLFLCILAYRLEWHMRQSLAAILFDDHDRAAGEALRPSPVAKARPSPAAKRKANTKRTDDGLPVRSFRTLFADLATLTRNTVRWANAPAMALLASRPHIQNVARLLVPTMSACLSRNAPPQPSQRAYVFACKSSGGACFKHIPRYWFPLLFIFSKPRCDNIDPKAVADFGSSPFAKANSLNDSYSLLAAVFFPGPHSHFSPIH